MVEFKLKTEYITLGQFIKALGLISSGGMIKQYLLETPILLNDVQENRRGKKLYSGDVLIIKSHKYKIVW